MLGLALHWADIHLFEVHAVIGDRSAGRLVTAGERPVASCGNAVDAAPHKVAVEVCARRRCSLGHWVEGVLGETLVAANGVVPGGADRGHDLPVVVPGSHSGLHVVLQRLCNSKLPDLVVGRQVKRIGEVLIGDIHF